MKRFMKGATYLCLCFVILISGVRLWRSAMVSCEELQPHITFAQRHVALTPNEYEVAFQSEYGLEVTTEWRGGRRFLEGEIEGFRISAELENAGTAIRNIAIASEKPPNGNAITACLGNPDQYRAALRQEPDALGYSFELWYLDEGLVVRRYGYARGANPLADASSDAESRFRDIVVVKPQALEEMVVAITRIIHPDELPEILNTFKVWTAWEDVVYPERTYPRMGS